MKRAYRERIADTAKQTVLFVHLSGSRELIAGRMKERTGHFMPQSLLDSQFAALETPTTDENAIAVDIDAPIERIIEEIVSQMEPETRPPSSGPSGHLLPPGEKG